MNRMFDPHNYALAGGWDFNNVRATASLGVSEFDRARLSSRQASVLRHWCRRRVREAAEVTEVAD